MTVSTITSKVIFLGTGSVSVFAYPFRIFVDTDLVVKELLISTGVETTLTLTTDYTVSGAGDATGGNVTSVAGNLPATKKLVIERTLPQTQAFDIEENDNAPSLSYENSYDRAVMLIQELQTTLDNSLRLPVSVSGVSTELPIPEADKVLVWASDGLSLTNQTLTQTDTGGIANGAITTEKLAASAVTAAKLATDAVETAKIKDDAVTEDKIQLSNNAFLEALDFAGTGTVDLIKANASDKPVLPDGAQLATNAAPTLDPDIVNKKYADEAGLANQKVGTFSYDVSTATGTQAITGVGFQPKVLILMASLNDASGSWGIVSGTTGGGLTQSMNSISTAYANDNDAPILYVNGGNTAIGSINSLDSDGFTIGWVKSSSPTGTLLIDYLAFR